MIVNCSGVAARELVPDPAVTPVRGQVVVIANPGIEEFYIDHTPAPQEVVYLFPHESTVVLGGTVNPGDRDTAPRPAVAERILRDCATVDPRVLGARVLAHRVGLRPARPEVRLEAEPLGGGRVLWHNYGHGGGGVTLSWGCALEIAAAVLGGRPRPRQSRRRPLRRGEALFGDLSRPLAAPGRAATRRVHYGPQSATSERQCQPAGDVQPAAGAPSVVGTPPRRFHSVPAGAAGSPPAGTIMVLRRLSPMAALAVAGRQCGLTRRAGPPRV